LVKPFEVVAMDTWNEQTQTGSHPYNITVTGNTCTFYAVYWDHPVLTAAPRQPGDGSPPPPSSGSEH
jgi:hypothetical protein